MRRGGSVCGAVSLVVIFCVLCMATFAALTFVTANRERALAELDAQRAAEFYKADFAATRIAAALRSGDRTLAALRDAQALAISDAETLTISDAETVAIGNAETLTISDAETVAIGDGGADALPEVRYMETDAGTVAEYSVPAGGEQRLDVRLLLRDGSILQWKKTYAGNWEADDSLILADIGDFMPLAEID